MTKQEHSNTSPRETTVIAYGFDEWGFKIESEEAELAPGCRARFICYGEENEFEGVDGVIIPQGIFESVDIRQEPLGAAAEVGVDHRRMVDRERELRNLLDGGGWACFLVRWIIDEVRSGFPVRTQYIRDTDLCKRVLNDYGVTDRRPVNGLHFERAEHEFVGYLRRYGVAHTVFDRCYSRRRMNVIASVGAQRIAIEFSNRLFFLPFHTTRRDWECLCEVVRLVTQAIVKYRERRAVSLPEWLDEFQFAKEGELRRKLESHRKALAKLEARLEVLKGYKAILTTQSEPLRQKIVSILSRYFGLSVDATDEKKEDAKLLDESGNPICFIEIRGVNRGVRREDINDVDSHRERNGLPSSVPGALFINNQMKVDGIDARLATRVAQEHIEHAARLNVLIVRTIDLLFLMRHLERRTIQERKTEFLDLLNSGGGWLRADSEGYRVIGPD